MTLPFKGQLETILLVDNHAALLKSVKQILEQAGFTVIPASSAKQAIRVEAEYPGTIDLLLSAIRMAGTSGPKLATTLKERRPQIRVVLMCGYPGGALLLLNYGWHYIEKAFVATVLVNRIKDVLRGESREQSTDRFDTLKVPRLSFGRITLGFHAHTVQQARRRA